MSSASRRPDWPRWALDLASVVATRSEDPHVKVGAVVFRADWSVVGAGYNGAPHGVDVDWSDREGRRRYVIHAEVNALRYATRADLLGGYLATTHLPCHQCMPVIASYGISEIWYSNLLEGDTYDNVAILSVARTLGLITKQGA
jgi:deoxycytidylate deaminase